MEDENKSYFGLINGLLRHDYYDEGEMTDDFLKQELYPTMSVEDYNKLTHKGRVLLKLVASSHMDLSQAEAFLTSQSKKRDSGFTDSQAKVMLKVWKTHRSRVHESLVQRSTWNNRLKNLKWRVDIKNQSKNGEEIHEPSAIVELQLENRDSDQKETEVIHFEMDSTGVSKVLQSLKDIEEQIKSHSE